DILNDIHSSSLRHFLQFRKREKDPIYVDPNRVPIIDIREVCEELVSFSNKKVIRYVNPPLGGQGRLGGENLILPTISDTDDYIVTYFALRGISGAGVNVEDISWIDPICENVATVTR
ncbi:MAG: hypothetical protein Q8L87_18330, partial [Anaerolineales bacterium]|nr:hypothetical protein [Anaerolineales bacterium]